MLQHISIPLQQEPVNPTLFLSVVSTYIAISHILCTHIEAIYVLGLQAPVAKVLKYAVSAIVTEVEYVMSRLQRPSCLVN